MNRFWIHPVFGSTFTTRTIWSLLGCTSDAVPMCNFPLATFGSAMSTTSPTLKSLCFGLHQLRLISDGKLRLIQRSQNRLLNFCTYLNLPWALWYPFESYSLAYAKSVVGSVDRWVLRTEDIRGRNWYKSTDGYLVVLPLQIIAFLTFPPLDISVFSSPIQGLDIEPTSSISPNSRELLQNVEAGRLKFPGYALPLIPILELATVLH